MPVVPVRLDRTVDLAAGFDAIRAELGVDEEFPAEVVEAATAAARASRVDPGADADLGHVPFVTVDPAGSRDLDQAVAIEREGAGYLVRYAIADVAAFVDPGGPVDAEARRRGVTIYLPDRRSPLHPPVLSEGAASLLPGESRPALVWSIRLEADGATAGVKVERATVRSRRALSYAEAQASLDAGSADPGLVLLRETGRLLVEREAARGGVSLHLPEQVVVAAAGRYELAYRAPLPVETWNAQISLLAGMSAARLMLDGGLGILRTLPTPDDETVATLRRRAAALGVPWPAADGYPQFVGSLDARIPDHAALVTAAARLFRGAGYEAFDGSPPADPVHAAVAAPYAHVTAPLRRLVDRFANEVVLALAAGARPPTWVTDALPGLPPLMAEARRREGAADGMAVDLVEAAVLASRVGDVVEGVVVSTGRGRAEVQVRRPAVVASVDGDGLEAGEPVRLRVVAADPVARRVDLEPVVARTR